MKPTLYTLDLSPPCRAVYMTEKALGIKLNHKIVDIFQNGHLKPDFLKINPKHTIPAFVDDELILVDSHAITSYLVHKYGKDDSLYPKDIKIRAVVDQMLHFDSNVAFPSLLNCCGSLRLKLITEITPELSSKIETTYSFLDKFLEGKSWVAGDHMTIADIHLVTTIVAAGVFVPFNKFSNIDAWVKRFEKINYYKDTEFSLEQFRKFIDDILKDKQTNI